MDIGINIGPFADSWKLVKRAEELGYSRVWFYDTQMLNADVFVAMTAAAMHTSRIRLGTGVLVPSNRIAPVAACALASVNALAPGRVDFGIAVGSTARSAMGLGPVKQADLAEYIRIVQALLRGETTEWDFEGRRRKIRFLNPEIGAIRIDDPIPLHISATGPKSRRLAASLSAGWIVPLGGVDHARGVMSDMKAAWCEAGTPAAAQISSAVISGCILTAGEATDSKRAKAQAGPHANLNFHNLTEAAERGFKRRPLAKHFQPLLDRFGEVYRLYEPADARYLSNHRGHLMFLRPEEEALCTADLIRATTFTAAAPELRDRVRALMDEGYSHLSIHIAHGHPEMLEEWAELFAGV